MFFFSSRRRHTRYWRDWSSDVCSSDLEMGENDTKKTEGLNTGGASGIQMADVSVDTETGVVSINKMVAVQDCGLVINPKTARSEERRVGKECRSRWWTSHITQSNSDNR